MPSSPDIQPSHSNKSGRSLRLSLSPTRSDGQRYYSTGRGGSGNMAHGLKVPTPTESGIGQGTPHINNKQEYYTTGRGGLGNMRKNKDEQETRKAQDVDDSPNYSTDPFPSASNRSIGRGGWGNVQAAKHQRESLLAKAKKLFK